MATNRLPTYAAYWEEDTTQGTGPANAAAWVSDGVRVRHIAESLDVTPLQRAMLEDERNFDNVLDYDPQIEGIKGGGDIEVPINAYLHGSGDTTGTNEAQIAATAQSNLWAHCLGGQDRPDHQTSTTGASTTAITLADASSFSVGSWVGIADSNSRIHTRRIHDITTDTLTLHRPLPFTPGDGARVYAAICIYIDEDTLEDSSAGPHTMSWLLQRGRGSAIKSWELRGCKTYISGFELARNAAPKVNHMIRVGNFSTPEAAPVPSWTGDPTGAAGRALGIKTKMFIQDFGTNDTENSVHLAELSVTPGVIPSPIPTVTEATDGMPGLAGYSIERNPCDITALITPHDDDWYTDFNARTQKHVQLEQLAPLGSAYSIYFPRVDITNDPQEGAAGNVMSTNLTMRALSDTLADTDLVRSRMCIVLC